MKTSKEFFKELCIGFMLIVCFSVFAQKSTNQKSTFLRVYNLEGRKINKGKMLFVNDSIMALRCSGNKIEIKFSRIGKIKTKRSGGHNVLMGSAVGASLGILVGVTTAEPGEWWGYTAGEGALGFGVLGTVGGAAIGGITAGFKDSETYIIDGDISKWKIFKEQMSKYKLD